MAPHVPTPTALVLIAILFIGSRSNYGGLQFL